MKTTRWLVAVAVVGLLVAPAGAQEFPKPGPEHELLKKLEGNWEATMKFAGMESKGTMTYKMDLGGLWLTSSFEGEFGGMKFQGKGLDSYDAKKKKYTGVWVDSMVTSPMLLEGTYDKEKKTLTMSGNAPSTPDGKPATFKMVTEFKDADTMVANAYMGDGPDPAFTISYKRKK